MPVKNDVKSHLTNRGEWTYNPLYQRNRDCPTYIKYSLFLPNVILTNSSTMAREPHGPKMPPLNHVVNQGASMVTNHSPAD